jgi:hypothetical protein
MFDCVVLWALSRTLLPPKVVRKIIQIRSISHKFSHKEILVHEPFQVLRVASDAKAVVLFIVVVLFVVLILFALLHQLFGCLLHDLLADHDVLMSNMILLRLQSASKAVKPLLEIGTLRELEDEHHLTVSLAVAHDRSAAHRDRFSR